MIYTDEVKAAQRILLEKEKVNPTPETAVFLGHDVSTFAAQSFSSDES